MHRSTLCPLSYSEAKMISNRAICIGQRVAGAPGGGSHYPGHAHLLVSANLVVSKGIDLKHIKNVRICKANRPTHRSPSPGSSEGTDLWTRSIVPALRARHQAARGWPNGRDDRRHQSIYHDPPQKSLLTDFSHREAAVINSCVCCHRQSGYCCLTASKKRLIWIKFSDHRANFLHLLFSSIRGIRVFFVVVGFLFWFGFLGFFWGVFWSCFWVALSCLHIWGMFWRKALPTSLTAGYSISELK